MENTAKIIQFSDYVGRKIPTREELKNNEDKIKAALDRIANNLKVLEKYGIKKNN
jgi:hypothetical protein